MLCTNCWSKLQFEKQENYYIERVITSVQYKGIVRKLIHQLKYQDKLINLDFFTKLIIQALEQQNIQFDYIIPVPLDPAKLMKRKYNHNSLLAKRLAKHYSKTVIHNALYKKPTTSQTKLNLAERKKNLKNSFIFNQKAKSLIKGKRILLLDDITTSGTTLLECTKTLNTAETAQIIPAVIAHTPRNIKTLTKDKKTL